VDVAIVGVVVVAAAYCVVFLGFVGILVLGCCYIVVLILVVVVLLVLLIVVVVDMLLLVRFLWVM